MSGPGSQENYVPMGQPVRQESLRRLGSYVVPQGYVVSRAVSRGPAVEMENDEIKEHFPWFCLLAFFGCLGAMVWEIAENAWGFQPFSCPRTCNIGPCYDDGSACESNLMLGPTIAVMDKLGAKNDDAIFDRGEWWRVITCNWLHAGVFHFIINMVAVLNLGVPLERAFGFWRIGILYIVSGLFGTLVSMIFLPYVLSVGASASVFGLVGACWADVFLNHCAHGTVKNAGAIGLLLSTVINLAIGLTPFVDNFMHCGGFVGGFIVGCSLLAEKRHPSSFIVVRSASRRLALLNTERRQINCAQGTIVFIAAILVIALAMGSCFVLFSEDARALFRTCSWCDKINCVEIELFTDRPWWSCCISEVPIQCTLQAGSTHVIANCTKKGADAYTESCFIAEDPVGCSLDEQSALSLCSRLCGACI